MAEFPYFGTFADSVSLVRSLLATGDLEVISTPRIVDTPQPRRWREWDDEIASQLRKIPRLYITGPFTRWPLGFERFGQGPEEGRYYFDPSHGGPVLGFSVAPDGPTGGRAVLAPGMLWYQPQYLDPETGDWVKPSKELKEAYRTLTRSMKSKLERFHLGESEVFIGPEALELYRSGKASLRWRGMDHEATSAPAPPQTGTGD